MLSAAALSYPQRTKRHSIKRKNELIFAFLSLVKIEICDHTNKMQIKKSEI